MTFVDDSAFFVVDRNAMKTVQKVAEVTSVIVCVFRMFGLCVNFKKGKTEVLLSLRGTGVREAKTTLCDSVDTSPNVPIGHRSIQVNIAGSDGLDLIVADEYKHLVSFICNSSIYVREAQYRARSAMAAFA